MAPVSYAAYRPAPRPPEKPGLPWWRTAGGWMNAAGWGVIVGALALVVVFFVRGSAEAGRRATEKTEMAREDEYLRRVNAWGQDTSFTAPAPERDGGAVPTSTRARRMWVMSRMLVDRSLWEREILQRHGVEGHTSLAAWDSPRYQASARDFPEVGRYLQGRAAATAEIQKASAAWMEARIAALARESGLPAAEVRGLFPADFAGVTAEEVRLADVMLEVHRHYVGMDPRVRSGGGDQLLYELADDIRRSAGIVAKLHDANAAANQARGRRRVSEQAAITRAKE
jgi:hypothetical protein